MLRDVTPSGIVLQGVIKSFRHGGLKRFFEEGKKKGIPSEMVPRVERRLAALDDVTSLADLGQFPGFRLHPLGGERKGDWAVWVTGNWRITFRFEGEDVVNVSLEDYH